MKRLTVNLPDDLEARFEEHLHERGTPPDTVIEAALREYLENARETVRLDGEAFPAPERPPRFAPAEKGSGKGDISVAHDRYLTDE